MKRSAVSQQDSETHITPTARSHMPVVDFSDTFSTTNHQDNLQQVVQKILTIQQRWIIYLFQLRNWLVRFLGLKTDLPADYNERFVEGGYVGFFRIYELSPDEVILGADDTHLNFRLSVNRVEAVENNIKVTTLVQFHNRLGKVYMAIVAPFHRMVVKKMVAQGYCAPQ